MIYAKNAGAWSAISALKGTVDGVSFSDYKDMYVNVGGTWKQLVPPNAVILYSSTAQYSGRANTYTAVADDKAVMGGTASLLTTGGATSHAQHGEFNGYTDYADGAGSMSYKDVFGTIKCYWNNTTLSHRHSNAHTHPNSGSNMNYARYRAIPTVGGNKVYAGAILPGYGTLTGAVTYNATLEGYYLHLYTAASSVAAPAASHNHGIVDTYSDDAGWANTSTASWGDGADQYFGHRHRMWHYDQDVTLYPWYINVRPYYASSDLFFDDLPSGTILLFTSARLPTGWSQWASANSRLLRFSSNNQTGGSSTHTHSVSCTTYTTAQTTQTHPAYNTWPAAGSEFRLPVSHSHTWTDSHATARDHMPPYRIFYIGKKN